VRAVTRFRTPEAAILVPQRSRIGGMSVYIDPIAEQGYTVDVPIFPCETQQSSKGRIDAKHRRQQTYMG
jgi:hypothetical protein